MDDEKNHRTVNQIHERFERDFLPRYGTLWRNMVERNIGGGANTTHPPGPSSTTAIGSNSTSNALISRNFMDAIENKTTVTIQVPAHSIDGKDCACEGCVPPVVEFDDEDDDEEIDQNRNPSTDYRDVERRQSMGTSTSSGGDSSSFLSSEASHQEKESSAHDYHDDSSHGNSASTPLPTDLAADFGRFLTFGEAGDDDKEEEEVEVEVDAHWKVEGAAASEASIPEDASTGNDKDRDRPSSPAGRDDDPDSEQDDEDDDGDDEESSGSSVIRFDISHIVVEATPAKGQQVLDTNTDINVNLFAEQLNPQFSPAAAKSGEEGEPNEQGEEEQGETLSPCQSSQDDSSVYNVDLSYIVQSPEREASSREFFPPASAPSLRAGEETVEDSPQDFELSMVPNGSDGGSSYVAPNIAGIVVSEVLDVDEQNGSSKVGRAQKANQSDVIDLVDTSDDDVIDVLYQPKEHQLHIQKKEPVKGSNTNDDLVDTSDDESAAVAECETRPRPRQHIKLDDDDDDDDACSDDNEWDGGSNNSSSSEFSFESPDEELDSEDGDTDLRRKSISKLARGTPRQPPFRGADNENWNPNKMPSSKPKAKGMTKAVFKKNREEISQKCFQDFDRAAFEGKLASVKVVWSNKLRTTAGLTRLQRFRKDFTPGSQPTRIAIIELSTKVLDDPERLESTLLHEMVHAAAWIIDGVSKPPHGTAFKKWANVAMRRIPGVEVTTTHDYKIQYKYAWACTTPDCKFLVQRHSRSVDLKRQCCGRCRGRLIEVDVPDQSSSSKTMENGGGVPKTPKKRAPPSGYNLFVKEHSKAVRERLTTLLNNRRGGNNQEKVSQADVMKECARLWQEKKELERNGAKE